MTYDGNCRLGDLFASRREKGREGLPTLSVTLNDGLVDREDLDRKMETNLAEHEHLLVRKGDIAYNMMRMWQGACGLAAKEGLVSPAYVVLKPKPSIDSRYAAYLFKTKRMQYLFWAYSYGLTDDRLRLYFPDFSRIPVDVPKVEEQQRIADALMTWDAAIDVVKKLIEKSKMQKRALSQKVLNGGRRFGGHTDLWRRVRLGEIAEVIVSNVDKKVHSDQRSVSLCNYTDVFHNAYITMSMNFMAATATESEIKKFTLKNDDVVITKDSETPDEIAVATCVRGDLRNVLCGYHLAIIRPRLGLAEGVFLSNLFALESVRYHFKSHANGVTRFGLSIDAIKNASFLIPSISEQKKISALILTVDDEIEMQSHRLTALRQERRAFIQRLLPAKHPIRSDVRPAYSKVV